jgi:hypothetical protein
MWNDEEKEKGGKEVMVRKKARHRDRRRVEPA